MTDTQRPEDVLRGFIVESGTYGYDPATGRYAEALAALTALTTRLEQAEDEVRLLGQHVPWLEGQNVRFRTLLEQAEAALREIARIKPLYVRPSKGRDWHMCHQIALAALSTCPPTSPDDVWPQPLIPDGGEPTKDERDACPTCRSDNPATYRSVKGYACTDRWHTKGGTDD